jgi:hypothetical protein
VGWAPGEFFGPPNPFSSTSWSTTNIPIHLLSTYPHSTSFLPPSHFGIGTFAALLHFPLHTGSRSISVILYTRFAEPGPLRTASFGRSRSRKLRCSSGPAMPMLFNNRYIKRIYFVNVLKCQPFIMRFLNVAENGVDHQKNVPCLGCL